MAERLHCGSSAEVAHGRPRDRVPMLWVRGFRDHTISGRGFNLFKPLRRHFRATQVPSCSLTAVEFHGLQ
jgi:hypothetical protein